jgi:hypothetical protein
LLAACEKQLVGRNKLAEVHGNRTHHGHLCPSLDLKSRRPTRTCPLPQYNLKGFLFKVNPFDKTPVLLRVDPENSRRGQGLDAMPHLISAMFGDYDPLTNNPQSSILAVQKYRHILKKIHTLSYTFLNASEIV